MSSLTEMQQTTLSANSKGNESQQNILNNFEGLDVGKLDGDRSLVGMNTDEDTISSMKAGIDAYLAAVQENIDKMNGYEESASSAFGPAVGATANSFVEAMKNSCMAVISQLNRFKDDIETVAAAYRAKGETVVGAIGSQAANIGETASSNTYEYSGK